MLDAETDSDGGVKSVWNCIDESPTRYFSDGADGVEMVCGEIDRFGTFVLVDIAEVNALKRIALQVLHFATETTGLSKLAVIIISLSVVFALVVVIIIACCVARERRRARRLAKLDDQRGLTTAVDGDDEMPTSDEASVAAFAALHTNKRSKRRNNVDADFVSEDDRFSSTELKRMCVVRERWMFVCFDKNVFQVESR